MANDIRPHFFTQVPSFLNDHGLNSTDKLVYGVIYTIINTNGICFKSNAAIAKNSEMAVKSVANSITKLKKKGFITTERTYLENSQKVNRRYIKLSNEFESTENKQFPNKGIGYSQIKEQGIPLLRKDSISSSISMSIDDDDNKPQKLNPFDWYYKAFGNHPNGIVIDDFLNYINHLSDEVVVEAIKRAGSRGKGWNYAQAMLNRWQKKNVKNMADVARLDKQHQSVEQPSFKRKSSTKKKGETFEPGDYTWAKEQLAKGKLPF